MTMFDETTINGWFHQAGAINLRRTERLPSRDLDAARGIILACVIGIAVCAWISVAVEWFTL